jgi:hypothetical protein
MNEYGYLSSKIKLRNIVYALDSALPEFDAFLTECIEFLKGESETDISELLREAVLMKGGIPAISEFARQYADKYPSIRKVLFSRKVQERLSFFVDSLLAPKNIYTDKEQFNLLLALIRNWKTENKEKSLSLENYIKQSVFGSDSSISLLNPESIIVKYEHGSMKISEFIDYLSFDLIPEEEILNENFPATLNQVIGISIRDYFLINYANENNYNSDIYVNNELNKWKSKLAYDEYKKYLKADKKLSSTELVSTLEKETKKLYSKYHITIYDEVLNNIEISETEKSSKGFYPVYLSGINRMAQPIVDGSWKQQ